MRSVIVWIDSKLAKAFEFSGETVHPHVFHRSEPEHHLDPHTARTGHAEDQFFHEVAKHLADTDALLVLGPGVAKDQFVHHLQHNHLALAGKVLAVESSDHPTDPQLVAHARKYFKDHHVHV